MIRDLRFNHAWGCEHPAEAVACMRDNPVDVVITDYNMAGMDGIAFARQLRTAPKSRNPFVPIIMVTEFATFDIVHAARDAGVNEFLAKPISPKALCERLAECLLKPRQFVAAPRFFGPDRRRRVHGRKTMERRDDRAGAPDKDEVMLFDHEWQPVIGATWVPRGSYPGRWDGPAPTITLLPAQKAER